MLYLLYGIPVLSFYIDVALTLFINTIYIAFKTFLPSSPASVLMVNRQKH